jgi:hypothetical protein
MAVALEHINIIVPIAAIERSRLPGGFRALQDRIARTSFCTCSYDGQLFCEGTVDPGAVNEILLKWEFYGLHAVERQGGIPRSRDLCVVDRFGGPRLPCDWLELDLGLGLARMKETIRDAPQHMRYGEAREHMMMTR